ncbi:membrane-bound PQQ-dependent dehydrogenase, glucose/quinate/shikimate family [Pseudomonas graminis]|uniref:membrane-bound PQQ-dependent dehydrogenase, glucose/quinate/shikimate family n=1 Tax=Pseudomonas graminis TaxID=158627 RepID=UPI003C15D01C
MENRTARLFRQGVGGLLALLGVAMVVGGAVLLSDGGSAWYEVAGIVWVICAIGVFRRDHRVIPLYVMLLAATVAWSVWEVGFDGWQLLPRLGLPVLLAVLQVASTVGLRGPRQSAWLSSLAVLTVSVAVGAVLHGMPSSESDPLLRAGVSNSYPPANGMTEAAARKDWPVFGNDQGGTRFSPLTQITPDNVKQLQVAWEAETGPMGQGPEGGLEVVPIMVGDTLYACNDQNRVTALDAETGKERWHQDISGGTAASGKPCRGVAFYQVPNAEGPCAQRIIAPNQMPGLVALDARTGELCEHFGDKGFVDLREGIKAYPHGLYYVSSAPQIIRGKVVVGGGIPDGQYWGGPSGVIRAFDAETGQLAWAYDSEQPDRKGAPPSGEVYSPSSPNSWAPISADETLGLVYLPMGNATPDNFGGLRRPGDDQVSSSVIALDAETGRLRWHFQTTHHDIWDYDVPAQPTLVDLPVDGVIRHGLIQATKRGEVFVLDRETGKPIAPVQEQAVPQGGIAEGERLSATQPASIGLPAFRQPTLQERDMWGITPLDQMLCRIQFRQSRYEGHLTPITLGKPVLIAPGSTGGINWGGVSVDIDHGVMVVNWLRMVDRVELVSREEAVERKFRLSDGQSPGGDAQRPMLNTPYGAYGTTFMSVLGTPCNAPPWGLISAVDLASGKLLWSRPLGTARDTGPLGIPSMLPVTVGTPMTGGSVSTRSGLIFIAATAERTIRALDVHTGEELWSARLPGGGNASPVTYIGPHSGRQFVVIAAGGKKALKTRLSNKIVAFALPAPKS